MIGLRFVVVGAREISGRFVKKAAVLPAEVNLVLDEDALQLLEMIKEHAPFLTGRYRESWHIEPSGNQRIVTTDSPYGRRLELGFYGQDALGREYNQAPQPHVGPAVAVMENKYVADMIVVATKGI